MTMYGDKAPTQLQQHMAHMPRKLIFATFEVRIEDGHLTAKASGEPIDVVRHEPAAEVKGATFTSLSVGQDNAGYWHAQCVLDV